MMPPSELAAFQRAMIAKAQPSLSDVHVNRPLTDMSVGWLQDQTEFVADKVFPFVPVQKQSDSYYTYSRADFYRSQARRRAPGTESAGGGFTLSTDTYVCHKYAIHKDVPDDIRQNADGALRVDQDATEWVTQQLLLIREITFLTQYFAPGVWTAQTTPGTLWSAGGSTPIQDIRSKQIARKAATGYKPNKILCGPLVYQTLIDHPDIIARINGGQTPGGPALGNAQLLARIFDVDEFLVAWGVQNSASEGATEATDFIAGKHLLLCYAAPRPGLMVPSAGYVFGWTGLLGSGAYANRMKKFRQEQLESDRIEGDLAFDTKLVANELGHFFNAAVA